MLSFEERFIKARQDIVALGVEHTPGLKDMFSKATQKRLESHRLDEGMGWNLLLGIWDRENPNLELVRVLQPLLDQRGWDNLLVKSAHAGPLSWFAETWAQASDKGRLDCMPVLGSVAPLDRLRWAMSQEEPLSQAFLIAALEPTVVRLKEDRVRLLLSQAQEPWKALPVVRRYGDEMISKSMLFFDKHWSQSIQAGESVLPKLTVAGLRFRKELPGVFAMMKGQRLDQRLPPPPSAGSRPKVRF